MERLLANDEFDQAYQIYRYGGHADPIAVLELQQPLRDHIIGMTHVIGINSQKRAVYGTVSSANKGQAQLVVHYNDHDEDLPKCHVGGRSEPEVEGCK